LRAALKMRFCFFLYSKDSSGFYDDLCAMLRPRQVARIALSEYTNGLAVNNQRALSNFYCSVKSAMSSVIFQQMGKCANIRQIIDCHYFDLWIVQCSAENVAADTTKTVNTYFYHL